MTFAITAKKRSAGHADIVRADKKIPGVLYGPQMKPVALSVGSRDFEHLYAAAGESSLIDVTVEGESAPVKALIQDVQYDPVKGMVTHVDFRQINMNKEMEVDIALEFIGESEAVKSAGGTLVKALDNIRVKCLPKDLVGSITIDISVLKTFEDAIHIKDIPYPAGIKPVDDGESVIAKVNRPLTEDELKKLEEAAAPVDLSKIEVEKKGKEEEAGADGEAAGEEKKEAKKEEKK